MKQFVKTLDKEGACFQYNVIKNKFTAVKSDMTEKKAGVSDGPQIRGLCARHGANFERTMQGR